MIVFGDRVCSERADALFARVHGLGRKARDRGHAHRAFGTSLLLEAGSLAQGLLDRDFARTGRDALTPLSVACARMLQAAAQLAQGELQAFCALAQALRALEALGPHGELVIKTPEGFALYAVYPELYARAAEGLQTRTAPLQVLGIRTIGTCLAALVAAVAGERRRLPYSVRPVGHPHARELSLDPALEAELLRDHEHTLYAVVDEGPGLSGSSFSAVVGWLVQRGVPRAHVVLFPSHAGEPGPRAPPDARETYRSLRKCYVGFEQHFLAPDSARPLPRWFEDVTCAPEEPVRDVSCGRWRALHFTSPATYPACHVWLEKRKFLVRAQGRTWLLKFVGLGRRGGRFLQAGRALARAHLVPELADVRDGFALMPWLAEAVPLSCARYDRAALVDALRAYLCFLVRSFPAPREAGAAPDALFTLMRHNVTELCGPDVAQALSPMSELVTKLSALHRPTATDNRLDAHEWLVTPSGSVLKSDYFEHHVGHDAIGCQDPSYDVVGAKVELGLTPSELETVLRALRDEAGVALSTQQLCFYELAYLSYRAGAAVLSAETLKPSHPEEASRFERDAKHYTSLLRDALSVPCPV